MRRLTRLFNSSPAFTFLPSRFPFSSFASLALVPPSLSSASSSSSATSSPSRSSSAFRAARRA